MASSARTRRKPTLTPTGLSRSNARCTSSLEANVQRAVQTLFPASEPARRRLPDPSPRRHGRGAALAPPAPPGRLPVRPHHTAARERTRPRRLPRSIRPRRRGWPASASSTPSPAGHVDLNRGLVSSLYNPYAAVPSMHVGYALIVAAGLLRHGRRLARPRDRSALPAVRVARHRRHRQPLLPRRRRRGALVAGARRRARSPPIGTDRAGTGHNSATARSPHLPVLRRG